MPRLIDTAHCENTANIFVEQFEKGKWESALLRCGGLSSAEKTEIHNVFTDWEDHSSDWKTVQASKTVWKTNEMTKALTDRLLGLEENFTSRSSSRNPPHEFKRIRKHPIFVNMPLANEDRAVDQAMKKYLTNKDQALAMFKRSSFDPSSPNYSSNVKQFRKKQTF